MRTPDSGQSGIETLTIAVPLKAFAGVVPVSFRVLRVVIVSACLVMSSHLLALTPMDESQMSAVSGSGIAIALNDFRFEMTADSYFEQIGSAGTGGFQRGDLRWYGLTMSEADDTALNRTHWTGAGCTGGHDTGGGGLGCPQAGNIEYFAAHDNPYLVRAFDYSGLDVDGSTVNKTVLDVLAPTSQDDYKWGFWGELEVGKSGTSNDALLKSQTMIEGNAEGSQLRLFQFQEESGTETLGLYYHSHLQGDFRFSVAQTTDDDTLGTPVDFEPDEGLHFVNVDAYLPLGHLHYQALTLDSVGDPSDISPNGNFVLELSRLPSSQNVYEEHYSLITGDTQGYDTALAALDGSMSADSNYFDTHGYARWGDWHPDGCIGDSTSCSVPGANDTDQGMFFSAPDGSQVTTYARTLNELDLEGGTGDNTPGGVPDYGPVQQQTSQVVNIGSSRVEGLNVQHLRLESLGVN